MALQAVGQVMVGGKAAQVVRQERVAETAAKEGEEVAMEAGSTEAATEGVVVLEERLVAQVGRMAKEVGGVAVEGY